MKLEKVIFMSRVEASTIHPRSTEAMISVSIPGDPAPLNQLWHRGNLLRLQFHDADQDGNIAMMSHQRTTYIGAVLFSPNDARLVIEFVEGIKNSYTTLYVHCDAGISRSSAIAKFVAGLYHLHFPDSYQLYNKYVYRVLTNTYNKLMYGE